MRVVVNTGFLKVRPKNNFPAAEGDSPIFAAQKLGPSPSYFSANPAFVPLAELWQRVSR
jgi:hypothetical protein